MELATNLPMMVWPRRSAVERFIRRTAAAPSEICDAFPPTMIRGLVFVLEEELQSYETSIEDVKHLGTKLGDPMSDQERGVM